MGFGVSPGNGLVEPAGVTNPIIVDNVVLTEGIDRCSITSDAV